MIQLPLFLFPSTIAWLDDEWSALETASAPFQPTFASKKFTTPHDATTFFNSYTPPLAAIPFLKAMVDDDRYDTIEHCPVDFNVLQIPALHSYEKRSQEISLFIPDLNMPGQNGIELCATLEHHPMRKILFTGENDLKQAVTAFNTGIIDKFVLKGQPDTAQILWDYAHEEIQNYFIDRSNALLIHMEAERPLPPSDPVFIRFFQAWCEKNAIREYYLFNKNGCFLCFNNQGERFHFILYTEQTLDYLDGYFKNLGNHDLHQAVASRQKIPFFGIGQECWQRSDTQFNQYLHTPTVLQGREIYYWAVVKG